LGNNEFAWFVSNGICSGSDTVKIIVYDIFIPDVITPNGDSENDYFVIRGIEDLSMVEFTVYNRWGLEVFYSADYQNDWGGTNKSGNELTNDTYFYVLNVNNSRLFKGYLVIKR
jgi:gliding motility-associated-like protein